MKKTQLIAGVSLIIFGLVLFIIGQYLINSATVSSSVSISGITVSTSVNNSNNSQVQLGNAIGTLGIIIGIIGIPFLIYGGIASNNKKHKEHSDRIKIKESVAFSEKHHNNRKSLTPLNKFRLALFIFLLVITIVIIASLVMLNFGSGTSSFFSPKPLNFNLQINNPGSAFSSKCVYYLFSNTGAVNFNWATNNGGSVTFSAINQSGTIYSSDASNGEGSFYTVAGQNVGFCAYDWLSETVNIHGTETFS